MERGKQPHWDKSELPPGRDAAFQAASEERVHMPLGLRRAARFIRDQFIPVVDVIDAGQEAWPLSSPEDPASIEEQSAAASAVAGVSDGLFDHHHDLEDHQTRPAESTDAADALSQQLGWDIDTPHFM